MTVLFRHGQAAADLVALLRPGAGPLAAALAGMGCVSDAQARASLDGLARDPWLPAQLDEETGNAAACLLLDPDTPEAFRLQAFALSLAAALMAWRDDLGLADLWPGLIRLVSAQPPCVRAAIGNAVREVAAGLVRIDPPVEAATCLSQTREEVCTPLCALARAAAKEDRMVVAMSDYGDRWERHLAKLEETIDEKGCIIARDDSWFPLETVQLKSHCPGEQGHLLALAVLLVTSVHNGDEYGDIEFRWERQAPDWQAFPAATRRAVMGGGA